MNPWRGLGGLPREVWILCSATLINRMGMMVLPFLVVYLTSAFGYTAERAGTVLMCYGLAAFIAAPFSGRLSDRIGPLLVMRISLLASGAMLFIYPMVRGYTGILIATFLWAVMNEAFRPAALAIITDSVRADRRKAAFAVNRLAINLGMSIGPALGGFLFQFSPEWLFAVDGATSVIAGMLLVLVPWNDVRAHRHAQAKAQTTAALRDAKLLYFLPAILPVMIIFFQHESAMPLYMVRDLGLAASTYGLMFTLNTVIIILLEVPLNIATAHIPHRTMLAIGAFLTGAGFGAMQFAESAWLVAATVVVWTFGEMVLLPGASAYMSDIAPPERRGEYMGLFQMTFSLAFALSAWVGPVLLEQYGGSVLWTAMFFAGCVSTLMFLGIPKGSAASPVES